MNTICPYCNYQETEHESVDGQINPIDKDISFCMKCGEVGMFKDKSIVKIELNSLSKEIREEINNARIAWLRVKAIASAKKND